MAQFSDPAIVLRTEGNSTSAIALTGSAFDLPLVYLNSDGEPMSLTGFSLSAKAQVYRGVFADDGKLEEIIGSALSNDVIPVPVAPHSDQTRNVGVFILDVQTCLLYTSPSPRD